jgi:hypothetical protein
MSAVVEQWANFVPSGRRLLRLSFGSGHLARRYPPFLTLDGTRIQRSLSPSVVRFELEGAEMRMLPGFLARLHWRFSLRPSVVDCNFEVSHVLTTQTGAEKRPRGFLKVDIDREVSA